MVFKWTKPTFLQWWSCKQCTFRLAFFFLGFFIFILGGSSNGATGSAALQRLTAAISKPTSLYTSSTATNVKINCGSANLINEQFGSVPSPAPNSTTNLTGISSSSATQMTKLTMLCNNNRIVHSTPISTFFNYNIQDIFFSI